MTGSTQTGRGWRTSIAEVLARPHVLLPSACAGGLPRTVRDRASARNPTNVQIGSCHSPCPAFSAAERSVGACVSPSCGGLPAQVRCRVLMLHLDRYCQRPDRGQVLRRGRRLRCTSRRGRIVLLGTGRIGSRVHIPGRRESIQIGLFEDMPWLNCKPVYGLLWPPFFAGFFARFHRCFAGFPLNSLPGCFLTLLAPWLCFGALPP